MLSALQPLPAVPHIPVKLPPSLELPKSTIPSVYSGKLQSQLWSAIQPVLQQTSSQPLSPARVNASGAVQVHIETAGNMSIVTGSLRRLGAVIQSYNAKLGIVQAWVKPAGLAQISRLSAVKSIGLPVYGQSSAGAVQSEGDALLLADEVRERFAHLGIDGSGVKIGVISDGVNDIGSVLGELPAININPAMPGNGNEGTAMLEIVHDLAPGAELYFSGPETTLDMVDAINWLVSQGCDIIVDDLMFPGEPYFADGPIAQAATAAANAGVTYITAAGNQGIASGFFGDSHYQGVFVTDGVGFHDYDPGPTVDVFKEMLVLNGATLFTVLQWAEAFGQSGSDFDLYLLNSTFGVIAASTNFQAGDDDPIEFFSWTNTTGADQLVRVLINWFGGDPARELEMFTFGGGTGAFEHNTTTDVLVGQQAAEGVIAVTAIWAADPGTDTIEPFASKGGSTIYTDFNAHQAIIRNSLDGAAIDGVQTLIGQLGFFSNPFFGTSAAGPHTAAIAALMLEANPSLNPAQVTQILHDTADDLTKYGIGYDNVSGAGRFNALNAVYASIVLPAPDLFAGSDLGISSTDNLTSDNTPMITGSAPDGAYVTLYINGVANQSVQLGAGVTEYFFTTPPLSNTTHQFTVRVAPSGSTPPGEFSPASNSLSVQIDTIPMAAPAVAFLFETGQRLQFTFAEDVGGTFSASDLIVDDLTHGGTIATSLLNVSGTLSFALFSGGLLANGNYRVTLPASSVTDAAGNPLSGGVTLDFFVLAGDANRDRVVDARDLVIMANNWFLPGMTFSQGNFDYTGPVDSSDLTVLAQNWQTSLSEPPPLPLPPVPTVAKTSVARQLSGRTAVRNVGLSP